MSAACDSGRITDGIVKTMQMYIDGSKQGKSELLRPAFHPDASFFGYAGKQLAIGTQFLFASRHHILYRHHWFLGSKGFLSSIAGDWLKPWFGFS
jgi:hypothetical protein